MKVVGAVSVMKAWVSLYMRGIWSARECKKFEYIKEVVWSCMIQSEGGQMPLTAKECDSNLLSVKCKKRASWFWSKLKKRSPLVWPFLRMPCWRIKMILFKKDKLKVRCDKIC